LIRTVCAVAGSSARWNFVAPFEQGKIGPDLFEQVCKFELEGLVSKRKDRPYRPGRSAIG
jgi:ATP-dependent DNA ligase